MFTLKLVLVFGVLLQFTLAKPYKGTGSTQFDIDMINSSQNKYDSIKPLVRRPRQNIFSFAANAIFNRALSSVGARGDWRLCRYTENGSAIYTNGIDTECRGVCEKTDVTCNDYYRPYFYNYFQ